MCGINGIWGCENQDDAEAKVLAMNNAIAHRGPDAEGIYVSKKIALGHRRLSIIDTSVDGNQPFYTEDKSIVIVFNGEIYNYIELREQLKGEFTFRTASDTEVILAAYMKWGIQCIQKFIGMFAFALYDIHLNKCFLVRDRLGIKPIYFSKQKQGIIFSSELRALLSTEWVNRKIDEDGLCDYMRYQTVHAPRTIIQGIEMLLPGHIMELEENQMKVSSYWDLTLNVKSEAAFVSRVEAKKEIADLLHSAVELRMRADVPFGAFLSGGIDSSAVVGLMKGVTSHPVKTFAITFHEKEWDESPFSTLIAKKFQTDHTEIRLSANDFLALIPDALDAMDHPSGDGPNTFVVSKVTRNAGVKMALSGLGGDELFAGYDVFRRMKEIEGKRWLSYSPKFIRQLAGSTLVSMKPSVASEKIAATLNQDSIDFSSAYPLSRQLFLDDKIKSLLKMKSLPINAVAQMSSVISKATLPLLSKVSVAEISSYMQNVLLRDTDQMSMAHSLEVRVPMIDHRLVEFTLGISDSIKFPHSPKQLLIESLGDMLPREIIDRPKMGFTFPWNIWMKNELKELCIQQLTYLNQLEYFKENAILDLWQRFLDGDSRVNWSRIWPLVVLGHWLNKHSIS